MRRVNRQKIEDESLSSGKVWQTTGTASHGRLPVMAMVKCWQGNNLPQVSYALEAYVWISARGVTKTPLLSQTIDVFF